MVWPLDPNPPLQKPSNPDFCGLKALDFLRRQFEILKQFHHDNHFFKKSPNEFALKTSIEYLNEIRSGSTSGPKSGLSGDFGWFWTISDDNWMITG